MENTHTGDASIQPPAPYEPAPTGPCQHSAPETPPAPAKVESNVAEHAPLPTPPTSAVNPLLLPQRRRVNPESLALRLGTDLVRDLDALILPGNIEMPSFAVRKELQERYSIDRRHIYDYFHSKGLRVIKEDKNGNPIPPKEILLPEPPNLRPLRQAPPRNSQYQYATYSNPRDAGRKPRVARGITKKKIGRPRMCPSDVSGHAYHELANAIANSPHAQVHQGSPSIGSTPTRSSPCGLDHLDEHEQGFVGNETLVDGIFHLEHTDVELAIDDTATCGTTLVMDDTMGDIQDLGILIDCDPSHGELGAAAPLPYDTLAPLFDKERDCLYKYLSDCLGPASGIQESVGSYRQHMQEQTRIYYEPLTRNSCIAQETQSASAPAQDQQGDRTVNEFRSWLTTGNFFDEYGNPIASRDLVASSFEAPRGVGQQTDSFSFCLFGDHAPTASLDELFPAGAKTDPPGRDVSASPVLRSRLTGTRVCDHDDAVNFTSRRSGRTSQQQCTLFRELQGLGSKNAMETAGPTHRVVAAGSMEYSPFSSADAGSEICYTISSDHLTSGWTSRGRADHRQSLHGRFAPHSPGPVKIEVYERNRNRTGERPFTLAARGRSRRHRTVSAGGGI